MIIPTTQRERLNHWTSEMMSKVSIKPKRWVIVSILLVAVPLALWVVGHRIITVKEDGEGVPGVLRQMWSIHGAMEQYKAKFGAYPTGDSHAVSLALTGNNPEHIVFIEFRQRQVGADGELLDPWGTPYRIYFSGDKFLVRSAGPNKRFDQGSSKDSDDYIY